MKPSLVPVLPVLLAATLATVAGCVHGSPSGSSATTQRRTITATSQSPGAFTHLDVRGRVNVDVHEGRPFAMSVIVTGMPESAVQTRLEGNTLVVDLKDDQDESAHDSAKLELDVPTLEAIVVDGSGDVTVAGAGAHPRFDIDVNGSGDVTYAGDSDLMHCRVEGSGDVKLHGAAKRLEVAISGSGDVDAHDFAAGGGQFDVDGSGDLTVDLRGGDTAIRVRGSGDVVYSGQARITSLDVSGSGNVHSR